MAAAGNHNDRHCVETDRGVEIRRVTPGGYRDTKRGEQGMSEDVHHSIDKNDHPDNMSNGSNAYLGQHDNPLYESRDYGVKVQIDTLSN